MIICSTWFYHLCWSFAVAANWLLCN